MKTLTQDADALRWLGNKRFADPGKMIDAFRETERAFRTAIPGENDPQERWDAFYKRMGRPDEPAGYEIKAPDGFEAAPEFTDGFRKVLWDNGIPPKAAGALVEWYNAQVISGLDQEAATVRSQQAALKKEWGAEYNANIETARRGMTLLDLDNAAVDAMARGFGVDKTMNLLLRIGTMTSEDMLRGGGGKGTRMTIDPASAQAQVDRFMKDSEKVAKLRRGDPTTKAEWDRLNMQQAAAREAQRARG